MPKRRRLKTCKSINKNSENISKYETRSSSRSQKFVIEKTCTQRNCIQAESLHVLKDPGRNSTPFNECTNFYKSTIKRHHVEDQDQVVDGSQSENEDHVESPNLHKLLYGRSSIERTQNNKPITALGRNESSTATNSTSYSDERTQNVQPITALGCNQYPILTNSTSDCDERTQNVQPITALDVNQYPILTNSTSDCDERTQNVQPMTALGCNLYPIVTSYTSDSIKRTQNVQPIIALGRNESSTATNSTSDCDERTQNVQPMTALGCNQYPILTNSTSDCDERTQNVQPITALDVNQYPILTNSTSDYDERTQNVQPITALGCNQYPIVTSYTSDSSKRTQIVQPITALNLNQYPIFTSYTSDTFERTQNVQPITALGHNQYPILTNYASNSAERTQNVQPITAKEHNQYPIFSNSTSDSADGRTNAQSFGSLQSLLYYTGGIDIENPLLNCDDLTEVVSFSQHEANSENSTHCVFIENKKTPRLGAKKSYDKKSFCTFCMEPKSKISNHLQHVHKDEIRVKEILSLDKNSKERNTLLRLLANEGNFKHNSLVLKDGSGQLVISRRPRSLLAENTVVESKSKYLPCEHCSKFILRGNLWRHGRKCRTRVSNIKSSRGHVNEDSSGASLHVLQTVAENIEINAHRVRRSVIKGSEVLLNSTLYDDEEGKMLEPLLSRMKNDVIKDFVIRDKLIRDFGVLRMQGLGHPEDQKLGDVNRVNQSLRTLARVVMEANKDNPGITVTELIDTKYFDYLVNLVRKISLGDKPSLNLPRVIGLLIHKAILCKIGIAVRANNDSDRKSAEEFQKLFDSEWNYRVNSAAQKKINNVKRNVVPVIPVTEDLISLRTYILKRIEELRISISNKCNSADWLLLAKLTMTRLILFNKRRRAEVRDLKVNDYLRRPRWHEASASELKIGLSATDRLLAERMDMVVSAGKSRKNVNAYIMLPPDAQGAIEVLLKTRADAGVPNTNPYLFSRLQSDTPFSGNTELQEIVKLCDGLKHPERITSTGLRKYIATVSQVLDMTESELGHLARHLGHDPKTHRDYYRLTDSTIQLSKAKERKGEPLYVNIRRDHVDIVVSQILMAVDRGHLHKYRGKSLNDIAIEDDIEEDDENDIEENDDDLVQEHDNLTISISESDMCQALPSVEDDSTRTGTMTTFEETESPKNCQIDSFPYSVVEPKDTNDTSDCDLSEMSEKKDKFPKKRWSEEDLSILLKAFGNDITEKRNPSAAKIEEVQKMLSVHRSVAQIRTQIHNYKSGKKQLQK